MLASNVHEIDADRTGVRQSWKEEKKRLHPNLEVEQKFEISRLLISCLFFFFGAMLTSVLSLARDVVEPYESFVRRSVVAWKIDCLHTLEPLNRRAFLGIFAALRLPFLLRLVGALEHHVYSFEEEEGISSLWRVSGRGVGHILAGTEFLANLRQ